MDAPVPARPVTVALVIVTIVGTAGWAAPVVLTPETGTNEYTVDHVYVRADDGITTATLYLPGGDEPAPGVVFGAGSGTFPRLYSNYGAALAANGFVVLVAGKTSRLEPGRPVRWESRRETAVLLESASETYLDWVAYLAAHPRVDEERLVFAGHSGGANSAYRAAYERPDANGVVAVAGRFPPNRSGAFPTNLLLATGSDDALVPPSTLADVARELTGATVRPGERVGSFENGTAVRVVVAEGATHLSESDDPALVRATTAWALRSVGESPPDELGVAVRSLESVVSQFLFGLVGVLGGTALTSRVVGTRSDGRGREILVAVVWLASFAAVLGTTLSRRVVHLGPMPGRLAKYVLLAVILLGVGIVLDRGASLTPRSETTIGSSLLDVAFLFVPAGAFVLASTQFVTFQLVTTVVLSSVALALLAVFLAELAVLQVHRRVRWIAIGLALVWLVPAVVPPYL